MTIYIIAAIALFLAVAYWRNRQPQGHDITVPTPVVLRKDLLFGYYGCETGQVAEVKGHTNLHWECQFHGATQAILDMLKMRSFTVLDVSSQLFERFADSGKNFRLRQDAESNLTELLDYLDVSGALQFVQALVPLDEPNTNCSTPDDLFKACAIIRSVAARYSELDGVKLACIYAAKPESFTCIEQFDLVGVDDYDMKSSILQGSYQALLAAKRPDAKTILLPGGAFGQDPQPFINWAHADGNVAAVVPFCWFGPREPADKWVGIGAGPLRETYTKAGEMLTSGTA